MQNLEPIDDQHGRSIGCVGKISGKFFAVTPGGLSRECGDRDSAIWWLKEQAAGRDPERVTRRPHVVELVALSATVISLAYYFYLWLKN